MNTKTSKMFFLYPSVLFYVPHFEKDHVTLHRESISPIVLIILNYFTIGAWLILLPLKIRHQINGINYYTYH